jgi:hypothetical protein
MLNYFPRWWPSWIGKKIIYWGNEIICCGNKIIYWGNKIICYGNKISFLWEQNNKLWEQDIILREQNKKNSHMALISQNFYLFCSLNIISCSYKKDILFPQQIILFETTIRGKTCRSTWTHYSDSETTSLNSFSLMLRG